MAPPKDIEAKIGRRAAGVAMILYLGGAIGIVTFDLGGNLVGTVPDIVSWALFMPLALVAGCVVLVGLIVGLVTFFGWAFEPEDGWSWVER